MNRRLRRAIKEAIEWFERERELYPQGRPRPRELFGNRGPLLTYEEILVREGLEESAGGLGVLGLQDPNPS